MFTFNFKIIIYDTKLLAPIFSLRFNMLFTIYVYFKTATIK